MKFSPLIAALCLAAAAPLHAATPAADMPLPNQMDPATLGHLDGLLTLCAKVDTSHRASYDRYRTELIVFGEGTPYEMRVPGSDTPAYKRAYAATLEAAGKASAEEQAAQCRRAIGAGVAEKQD